MSTVKPISIIPIAQTLDTPIVEDRRPTISTAKTFLIHTWLSQFLTAIDHHRISIHGRRNNHARDAQACVIGKKRRSDTLLIMVLQEIEHVRLNIPH